MKAVIEITEKAKEILLQKLENSNKENIKLSLKTTGCSGNSYNMAFVELNEINRFDEIIVLDNKKFVIDSKAVMAILGTKMDWIENGFDSKFEFKNPNVDPNSFCGCGESFKITK